MGSAITAPRIPVPAAAAAADTSSSTPNAEPENTSSSAATQHGQGGSARTPGAPVKDPWRIVVRFLPLAGLALSVGLVWWGLHTGVLRSLTNLQAFIDSLGLWGPVVFVVVSVASVMFPIIPGGLLVIAGPLLFGAVNGTLLNYLAVCTGSILNFTVTRYTGMALIERLFSARAVDKYLGWTRSPRFTSAFAAAIALPVAPDDLLCYLAGTTRMRWSTYVLIILTCKPWSLIVYGLGGAAVLMKIVGW